MEVELSLVISGSFCGQQSLMRKETSLKIRVEFWVERSIQRSKKWIKDRVTSRPEILMEATLDLHSTKTREIEKALFPAAQVRVNADKRDDPKLFAHFLDAGRAHDVHFIFDGHAQSLADFLQIAKPEIFSNCHSHEQKLELIGQMSALVFERAQVGHEQFAPVDFHRSTSRCSHHARFENRLAAVNKYGRILRYYRLQLGANCVRLCEIECFADVTTQADAELGYSTVRTSTPTKMFVSLSDIRCKVILFEPPACKARSEARVLQCWTKGRV